MQRFTRHIVLYWLVAVAPSFVNAQLMPNLGGQRAGISSLQFLKIGVGGRGAALGEAAVAVINDVSSLYWNPAGLTYTESNAVLVSHTEWLVEMKHDFVGASFRISDADVLGVSLISLATDDMMITTETQPFGTGLYFKYSDLAIGVSYARQMTQQFSFGTTVRYVRETLGDVKIQAVLFDLGTYYHTGLGSTRFGMVVSNFGGDVRPEGTVRLFNGTSVNSFQSFSPPTIFKLGVAFEAFQDESQQLTVSTQLNHPNDNAENLRLGLEYNLGKWLFARAGFKRTIGEPLFGQDKKSADDFSAGFGVVVPTGFTIATFDYAFTNFNDLGAVHRLSLSLTY